MAGGEQNAEKLKNALLVAVDFLRLPELECVVLKKAVENVQISYNSNRNEFKLKNVPPQLISVLSKNCKSFRESKESSSGIYISEDDAHAFFSGVMGFKGNPKKSTAPISSPLASQPPAPQQPRRGLDSGTASTASSAQSSPAGSPGRPVSCNQQSLSDSISGEQPDQNTLFNDSLANYLRQLNQDLNKTEWNTKGFTFFHRHVPLHIKEMRAVFLGYNLSPDNRHLTIGDLKQCFAGISGIIKEAVSKNPFFRDTAVKEFYKNQSKQISAIEKDHEGKFKTPSFSR